MTRKRRLGLIIGIQVAIVLVVFLFTLRYLKPAAPREMVLLTGPDGSGYEEYGHKYAAFLSQHGITVHVVETAGSVDNLRRLLSASKPTAAFVQSGVEREAEEVENLDGAVSLGSLYFEPLWLFVRRGMDVERPKDLEGLRVALGPKGSGSRAVARRVLRLNQVEEQVITTPFDGLTPTEAADALLAGEIDAAFVVGVPSSSESGRLLESRDLAPVSFPRTKAYERRNPDLAEVILPEGAFDLARNIPDRDLHLIASTANLVTRDDMHPAAIDLLLDAARDIHRESSLFAPMGAFPTMDYTSLPLSPAAVRYYREGPSALRRILPFRAATLVDRFLVVVVPVLTAAFALIKILPAFVKLRFSVQLQQLYRQLEAVEKAPKEDKKVVEVLEELDALDRISAKLRVPRSQIGPYFEFRQNIHDVRERVSSL